MTPDRDRERLEQELDSFDPARRKEALCALHGKALNGGIVLPQPGPYVNLHCHTFFSYNAHGYSPSKLAWLARKMGLAAAGIVDFDVLDGLEEFQEAGHLLGLQVSVGMETRVYLPEFGDKVVNSPGEPGIAYLLGVGFPTSDLQPHDGTFLLSLRATADQRNRQLVGRVNEYLTPVVLDYDREVLPLTPSGNATERHICLAYARKARALFGDGRELAAFWAAKLGANSSGLDLPEGFALQSAIRARTMKRGGVGYVQPGRGSFPEMAETCEFILKAGGLPTHCWLDGTSEAEADIEELLEVAIRHGAVAVDIIVDLSYATCPPEVKTRNLFRLVALVEELGLIVVAGTEMNRPHQQMVDEAALRQLAPLLPVFLKGAHIVYAHSVLQQKAGLGYTGDWARQHFPARAERNEFFRRLGSSLQPSREHLLEGLGEEATPQAILDRARH